jgi:tetratricopeptide (TPR) repeat protein
MNNHYETARVLLQSGDPALAEKEVRAALSQDPNDALSHCLLALCLDRLNRLDEATNEAKRAVELAPDLAFAQRAYSVALVRNGAQLDLALKAIQEAVRLDPTEPSYRNWLATINRILDQRQGATQTPSDAHDVVPSRSSNVARAFVRHLAFHGVVALIVAATILFVLSGLDPRVVVLFAVPPAFAAVFIRAGSATQRTIAWAFLAMIGIGSVIAHLPMLFPNLGGINPQLANWGDRMLTWYAAVYILWFIGVLPVYAFCSNLAAHKQGRPAWLSPFTCCLGLLTTALVWTGMAVAAPIILKELGFLPLM